MNQVFSRAQHLCALIWPDENGEMPKNHASSALLRICRLIHHEALSILYRETRFLAMNLDCAKDFIAKNFPSSCGEQTFRSRLRTWAHRQPFTRIRRADPFPTLRPSSSKCQHSSLWIGCRFDPTRGSILVRRIPGLTTKALPNTIPSAMFVGPSYAYHDKLLLLPGIY